MELLCLPDMHSVTIHDVLSETVMRYMLYVTHFQENSSPPLFTMMNMHRLPRKKNAWQK